MRKTSISIAVVCCVVTLCTFSCRKKQADLVAPVAAATNTTTVPPPTIYHGNTTDTTADKSTLNALFSALRTTPQSINVTAGKKQVVNCAGGTIITFYPSSFRDAGGNVISSGTVNLQVVEMYKPGLMIAERAVTTSEGQLLVSGGQVRINATIVGGTVYAGTYGIAFKQAAASSQPMSLFYGSTANKDSLATWGAASTLSGASASGTKTKTMRVGVANVYYDRYYYDSIGAASPPAGGITGGVKGTFYEFDSCRHFDWINCDRFYGGGSRTKVTVTMSDTSWNKKNTETYLVFPSVNGAMHADYSVTPWHGYSYSNVPEGLTATAVVIASKDGNLYYGEKTGVTVTTNMNIALTLTQQSTAYIKGKLAGL